MNFKQEIKKLAELQKIDSDIYDIKAKKDTLIPAELKKLKEEFSQKQKELSIFEEKSKQLQLKKKEREIELASKEESLKKAQGQLYQLKTNKEYQAKLGEIGSIKADISVAEDGIIGVLDELEEVKNETESAKDKLAREEERVRSEEAQLTRQSDTLEKELQSLEAERSRLAKDIDDSILNQYEQLLQTRQGKALAAVNHGNCGACYLQITPQTINEIKMYAKPILCENCVRMLYIPEDIE